ncbi:MAG: outer membrane lipoprotein carrier protein LolA [Saprospiraceae bacterium]|nr:outer membrane lipoprotein carrier protein LolA [Saprospiraceae bacterium]
MFRIAILLILLPLSLTIRSQNATFSSKKDIDPKAKQILDKLKKQYDSYKTMEVKFELTLELPGQSPEIQKGSVIQDGKKYQVKMNDQEIYADGKNVWVYLKKNKEVQISDMDETGGSDVMSPKQMLRLYETENFVYAITAEKNDGGKQVVDIEFKPLDKKSEYTKMRLSVDKKENKMLSLHIFSRDGSRYTLKVNDILSNKTYDPTIFSFNPKAYPGVHIEDLRID